MKSQNISKGDMTYLSAVGMLLASFLVVLSVVDAQSQSNKDGVDLDTWEAPKEMKRAFPYYISGLDYENQPVFVLEYGKWNVRKYFEEGGDRKTLELYRDQMMYRWGKAERNLPSNSSSKGQGKEEGQGQDGGEGGSGSGLYDLIVDMEGYETRQLTHTPSLLFTVSIATKFVEAGGPSYKIDSGFAVNMNYIAETMINTLLRPVLGQAFEKFELSGTNKVKWIPSLLKKIPKESLPTWYGGSAEFKPLAIYG